jgi:hypothetical protein
VTNAETNEGDLMKKNGTSIVIAACALAGLQSGLAQTNDIRLGNIRKDVL